MYKIRPRRTRPQALLMLCMLLSFIMLAINIIIYELTPQYTSYGSQHYQVTFPFIMLAINIIIYELTPQYTSYGSQHYQVTFPFIMLAINIIIYELTPQYTSYGSQHYQVTFPFIMLAINIIIYELTPQYTSYGSQHYQVPPPPPPTTPWEIFHAFMSSADFFKLNFFEKFFQEFPSECQTVWILIRPTFCQA